MLRSSVRRIVPSACKTICGVTARVSEIAPLRSRSALLKRPSTSPLKVFGGASTGIRLSTTLTTPPIAPEPNRIVAGPRITSILWLKRGLTLGAWSGLKFETSNTSVLSLRTRTRLSASPRMTGRLAPGAKPLAPIPGSLPSVSPSVASVFNFSSFSFKTVTAGQNRWHCGQFHRPRQRHAQLLPCHRRSPTADWESAKFPALSRHCARRAMRLLGLEMFSLELLQSGFFKLVNWWRLHDRVKP